MVLEVLRTQRGELLDAGVHQEALETEDAGGVQRGQFPQVPGHGAAPEADVDEALALGTPALHVQRGDVDRRRDAVERHVQDRGDAAGGGRPRRRREALPLGASGFVDVHVGVDEAREEHDVVPELDDAPTLQARLQRLHRGDAPVGDPDAAGLLAPGRHETAGTQDRVVPGHEASGCRGMGSAESVECGRTAGGRRGCADIGCR